MTESPGPRPPSPLRRGLDRLRFSFERLILRGLRYRMLVAALIVAAVAIVFGALVAILDPGLAELDEAVWWAFLRLTDPGYLGDDEGIARRTISTVLTVLGYVLFLGLLIAILTQWLNQTISKLESGVTPVALSDHVIILGWTHRTPSIVSELLQTGARARRFLALHGARKLRIVILAEDVDEHLRRQLRERLGSLWNDRQVLLRAGSALRVDHLERVAFRDAAVLILPGADFADRDPAMVDAETVKTLSSVSKNATGSGALPPLAVVGLVDIRNAGVARRAYAGDTEMVAADDSVSRLLAQSILQRGIWDVFYELLTLGLGNSLFVRKIDGQAGARFGDLRGTFPRAILLGTVRAGDLGAALAPDPQTIVTAEDQLVFIARSFEECAVRSAPRPGSNVRSPAQQRPHLDRRRRVLILGFSRKVPPLLAELARYGPNAFTVDIVSAIPAQAREQAIERHCAPATSHRVRQIELGRAQHGVLERLEPQRYDNIVMLASERLSDEEEADATTVFSYLQLGGILPEQGARPELLVELLAEENRFLFAPGRQDVIVSPRVVSYLLSQVALRRELAAVFSELSRPWGAQIALRPAAGYIPDEGPVRFADLEAAAAARGEIALGLRRGASDASQHENDSGLALNPDRERSWTLAPDVELVVLARYAEADSGA